IPLFILAGALMETGGIAVRLVVFAQALVGWIRGGLAMAVVIAEYIFSGISGSTIADVSAIGSTMIPPMTRAGYRPEQAVSVVAAASAMGILVPPCILMIVIGAIANVSVAALFVGGFIPALVLAVAIMAYIYWDARREGIALPQRTTAVGLWRAFRGAVLEGLPAVVIVLPTFLPVVKQLNIDLVHYCIVVVAATGIGLFLPPIGVGLFISCAIANITVDRVVRPMLPYVLFLCIGLLFVILVPWFTLVLPRLFGLCSVVRGSFPGVTPRIAPQRAPSDRLSDLIADGGHDNNGTESLEACDHRHRPRGHDCSEHGPHHGVDAAACR